MSCLNGATRQTVQVKIYGATVTLDDPSAPVIGTPSGGAWSSTGWVSGAVGATVPAGDNTGIKSTRILVDDVVRGTAARSCDYTLRVPCTDEPGAAHTLDTTALADGAHSVAVSALDAAGNDARASRPGQLLVDNHAPSPPQSLAVSGGTTRSTGAFDASWALPVADNGAPIVRSRFSLCRQGTTDCVTATRTDDLTHAHLEMAAAGPHTLRVWLEDAAGQVDQTRAASLNLTYAPPSAEPGPAPAPTATPEVPATTTTPPTTTLTQPVAVVTPAPRADPRLRWATTRRKGNRVSVSGRIAASGRVLLTYSQRVGHRTLRMTRTLRPSHGTFRATLRLRGGLARASRGRLTASYAGDPTHLAARIRRTVSR